MLYINFGKTEREAVWHIGESLPYIETQCIQFIQADGDELDHIKNQFGDTIPFSKRPVQSWYGDFAKSIVFALR